MQLENTSEHTIRLSQKSVTEDYLPNVLLKAFKNRYSSLFLRTEQYYSNMMRIGYKRDGVVGKFSSYDVSMMMGTKWYPELIDEKRDTFHQDTSNMPDLFLCMYDWDKSRIAYNYPEEELKRVGNIDDLKFEAKYFVEMPFHSFYFEGNKDWNVHGIMINIVEVPISREDADKRVFRVNAIVLCEGDTLETLNLEEANISFLIAEGDTYGSLYPGGDSDSFPLDYYEGRNGVLQYSILYMCYLLYKISHEKNPVAVIGNGKNNKIVQIENLNDWDVEHRVVYDDLMGEKTTKMPKERIEKEQSDYEEQPVEIKKKRKSPRPHRRAGTEGHRWCGSGENRHLERRWIKGSFPNGNKGDAAIPVVEHRKK